MHDLVVTTLQKCRVDRAEWGHAFRRKTRRKRKPRAARQCDVEHARRERCPEAVEARPVRHRSSDRDDARIVLGLRDQGVENTRVVRMAAAAFGFVCVPVATLNCVTP